MPVILYGGFEVHPFLRGIVQNYITEDLVVVANTVHDYMFSGLRICYEADNLILAASKIGGLKGGERYACYSLLEKMGESAFPPVPEEMLAFSIFRHGVLQKGASLDEAFERLCGSIRLGFMVIPITEDMPSIRVKADGKNMRLLEFLLSKEEGKRVGEARADWEFKPLKRALNVMRSSESILIVLSDPISILPTIRNEDVRNTLRNCEGEITLICPPISPKSRQVLNALKIEASPLGVARVFEGLTDRIFIDDAYADLKREISSLDVEVITVNISQASLEGQIPKAILEAIPLRRKRAAAIRGLVKTVKEEITKAIGQEKEEENYRR